MRHREQDRLPPHSEDAERGVLGCVLLDPRRSVDAALEALQGFEMPFYNAQHQLLFTTIRDMLEKGEAVDLVTIQSKLTATGDLEKVGGCAGLMTMMDSVPSAANIGEYLKIVREKAMLRKAIATCARGIQAAHSADGEPETVIHNLEAEILAIRHAVPGKKAQPVREVAVRVIGNIEDRINRRTGLATGFYELDKWTAGGLQPGEMWVLAGRPSMGKTSLGMDIARNVAEAFARVSTKSVMVFSLEMTAEALTERLVAGIARVKTRRDEMFSEDEMAQVMGAIEAVNSLPIIIDDTSNMPISVIKSRARAYYQRFDVGLFLFDYLTLASSEAGRSSSDRRVEVDLISAGLKSMAKELGVPWIVIAQLNRDLERDKSRKPRLSDLRESGAIEQDADFVGMLYAAKEEQEDGPTKEVNLLIAKQRNGPRDKDIPLIFNGEYTRFDNATIKERDIPR